MNNINFVLFSFPLFFSSFILPHAATAMEEKASQECADVIHALPLHHPQLKAVTAEDLTSSIKSNIDKNITSMISLTMCDTPKKFNLNYLPSDFNEILSLQLDISNSSILKSIADIVPSSVDLITFGPVLFKKIYLDQEQSITFFQILGSMLKNEGVFIVTQKEICRGTPIEEDRSQPQPPRLEFQEETPTINSLSNNSPFSPYNPDYPSLIELSKEFLQGPEVTWEMQKLHKLLYPNVKEPIEHLIVTAREFGFEGAPLNHILDDEESLRTYVGIKLYSSKRKREDVIHSAEKKKTVKRQSTENDSYLSYEVFNTSDLYFVKSILEELFQNVVFYRNDRVISKPSEKEDNSLVAQYLKINSIKNLTTKEDAP